MEDILVAMFLYMFFGHSFVLETMACGHFTYRRIKDRLGDDERGDMKPI